MFDADRAVFKYQSNYFDQSQQVQSKQSEFVCKLLKAQEKSRVQVAIGFAVWLINWRGILKPINKRGNCNREISFDSQSKTALTFY